MLRKILCIVLCGVAVNRIASDLEMNVNILHVPALHTSIMLGMLIGWIVGAWIAAGLKK